MTGSKPVLHEIEELNLNTLILTINAKDVKRVIKIQTRGRT